MSNYIAPSSEVLLANIEPKQLNPPMFTLLPFSQTSVLVEIGAVVGATRIVLSYKQASDTNWTEVICMSDDVIVSNMNIDVEYQFQIRAETTNSNYSDSMASEIQTIVLDSSTQYFSLALSAADNASVNAVWTNVVGVDKYKVVAGDIDNKTELMGVVAAVDGAEITMLFTPVRMARTFYVRVIALDENDVPVGGVYDVTKTIVLPGHFMGNPPMLAKAVNSFGNQNYQFVLGSDYHCLLLLHSHYEITGTELVAVLQGLNRRTSASIIAAGQVVEYDEWFPVLSGEYKLLYRSDA